MATAIKDRNSALMRAMGSKSGSYDPEAPDWCLWVLNHSDDTQDRLLAYLKTKTTHRNHHSPKAIDSKTKKPITLRRLADDCGWLPDNARKYLQEAEDNGMVRLEKSEARHGTHITGIYLSADIPAARTAREQPPEEASENGESKAKQNNLYRLFKSSYHDCFEQLEKAVLAKMEKAAKVALEWGVENLEADAISMARSIEDRIKNSILAIAGLEKKNGRRDPADRPRLVADLKLTVELPPFVQAEQSVQTAQQSVQIAKSHLYNGKLASAQTATLEPANGGNNKPIEQVAENGKARAFSDVHTTDKDFSSSSKLSATTQAQTEEEGNRSLEKVPACPDFKRFYPSQKFDEAQALPLFEALNPAEKIACMRGLARHLNCKRWSESLRSNDGRYVPLASRFINKRLYAFEPPPFIPDRRDVHYERSMQVLANLKSLWGE